MAEFSGRIDAIKTSAKGALFATGAMTLMSLGMGAAQAQVCEVGGTSSLAAARGWGPAAVCAGMTAATGFTSALSSANAAFFTQTSAFWGSPGSPSPNQWGNGPWVRGVGGFSNERANVSSNGALGSFSSDAQTRLDFAGIQGGFDLGRYNLNGSGTNLIFGVTGGQIGGTSRESGVNGRSQTGIEVPFIGGYVALTSGGFFWDAQVRGEFYQMDYSNPLVGLDRSRAFNGDGISFTSSIGYRHDLGPVYVEPSAGVLYSRVSVDSFSVPGRGDPGFFPSGTYTFDDIESLLARAGLRVGASMRAGSWSISPYVTGSIWHEFADNVTLRFNPTGVGDPVLPISLTRIGTFAQAGLGISGQYLNTGPVMYLRADFRTGDNIQSAIVNGGFRWQF